MANLAIKGHETRGNEVIKILEMLGGSNPHNYSADCGSLCFYIGENTNSIYYDWVRDCYKDGNTLVFTLEEFFEKFPYKVGDKVVAYAEGCLASFTIQDMRWNHKLNKVEYKICSSWLDDSLIMRRCKEETMEKEIPGAIINRFICLEGYDFYDDKGNVIDTKEITMKKKKPKYPKTYEECCKVLGSDPSKIIVLSNRKDIIHEENKHCYDMYNLYQLLICRDAYWKIAGEQMGLGKPWKPYWSIYEHKFCIGTDKDKVLKECVTTGNRILAFPTKEMRDAFYENFKELIEECKELL